ncbi:MAG: hypothetical protein PQ275_27430 [Elizabethkingia anophelis]|nr:MAG: hypothetical protein PQ275_27430 [Elizabethkingia anophelis]
MTIPDRNPEEFIQVDIALFHESIKHILLAGLLTYFSFAPSHYKSNSDYIAKIFYEVYSSGSVQDLHLIPF